MRQHPYNTGDRTRRASRANGAVEAQVMFVDSLPDYAVPPDNRAKKRWGQDIAPKLKEHPGRWALLFTFESTPCPANARVAQIRAGKTDWSPKGAFEAMHCKTPTGGMELYARYVGGEEQ